MYPFTLLLRIYERASCSICTKSHTRLLTATHHDAAAKCEPDAITNTKGFVRRPDSSKITTKYEWNKISIFRFYASFFCLPRTSRGSERVRESLLKSIITSHITRANIWDSHVAWWRGTVESSITHRARAKTQTQKRAHDDRSTIRVHIHYRVHHRKSDLFNPRCKIRDSSTHTLLSRLCDGWLFFAHVSVLELSRRSSSAGNRKIASQQSVSAIEHDERKRRKGEKY